MDAIEQYRVLHNIPALISSILPEDLTEVLLDKQLITEKDAERISHEPTLRHKNARIWKTLLKKRHPKELLYAGVVDLLLQENYIYAVELLEQTPISQNLLESLYDNAGAYLLHDSYKQIDHLVNYAHLHESPTIIDEVPRIGAYNLHHATIGNDCEAIHHLLNTGTQCDLPTVTHLLTPLHLAVIHNRIDPLSMLLEHGADTEVRDSDGNTPLTCAITLGRSLTFRLLLRYGADATARNKLWATPLHAAAYHGRFEMTAVLVKRTGVNVNCLDRFGDAPLHHAVAANRKDVVLLLLRNGASRSLANNYGYRPLDVAIAEKLLELVKILSSDFDLNRSY